MDLAGRFEAQQDIALATAVPFPGNDRFRVVTLSSMFATSSQFDADAIRYEAADGAIRTISLTDSMARGQHLFASPDPIGGWLELVKGPGSSWFPDSPTIRLDILDNGGRTLGLQAFLDSSLNPNDDSLSVWLEWLDAPSAIPAGTIIDVQFRMTAVPEPAGLAVLTSAAALLCAFTPRG